MQYDKLKDVLLSNNMINKRTDEMSHDAEEVLCYTTEK
jgi:hypothetical protein